MAKENLHVSFQIHFYEQLVLHLHSKNKCERWAPLLVWHFACTTDSCDVKFV